MGSQQESLSSQVLAHIQARAKDSATYAADLLREGSQPWGTNEALVDICTTFPALRLSASTIPLKSGPSPCALGYVNAALRHEGGEDALLVAACWRDKKEMELNALAPTCWELVPAQKVLLPEKR